MHVQYRKTSGVALRSVARGKHAVASSSHPAVTDAMVEVLRTGGGAADAGIAGCVVQAAVEPYLTRCAGTVTCLYWDAATRTAHQLESSATLRVHSGFHARPGGGLSAVRDSGMAGTVPTRDPRPCRRCCCASWTLASDAATGLARKGMRFKPLPAFDVHMGSFQASWRDRESGLLNTYADPRRPGKTDGIWPILNSWRVDQ